MVLLYLCDILHFILVILVSLIILLCFFVITTHFVFSDTRGNFQGVLEFKWPYDISLIIVHKIQSIEFQNSWGKTKQTKYVMTCGANCLLGKMTQQWKYSQMLLTASLLCDEISELSLFPPRWIHQTVHTAWHKIPREWISCHTSASPVSD